MMKHVTEGHRQSGPTSDGDSLQRYHPVKMRKQLCVTRELAMCIGPQNSTNHRHWEKERERKSPEKERDTYTRIPAHKHTQSHIPKSRNRKRGIPANQRVTLIQIKAAIVWTRQSPNLDSSAYSLDLTRITSWQNSSPPPLPADPTSLKNIQTHTSISCHVGQT